MSQLSISCVEAVLLSMVRSSLFEENGFVPVDTGRQASCSGESTFAGCSWDAFEKVYAQCAQLFGVHTALPKGVNFFNDGVQALYAALPSGDAVLSFRTSGSTGEPVECVQPLSFLMQEIRFLASLMGDRKRVVGVVPQHHIYGFLFTVLLPSILNIPVVIRAPYPGQKFLQTLSSGDLVVAFPMFWQGVAALQLPMHDDVYGVTSTGPCPKDVLEVLQNLGIARITEVYGSSETGGVGYRHNCHAPYTLFSYWDVQEDQLLRTDEAGKVLQAVNFPDMVEWHGAKQFLPLKRKDNAVQVAGRNVYPARVEKILCTHPQVKECSVRLMRPDEGARLKAFIVPTADAENNELTKQLFALCKQLCTAPERPKSIVLGDTLPRNAMGKLQDWQIA